MRVSKSIHVTTDNSFEDEALALDNRSDSVAQRHKVDDSNSKVWRTTVKKSSNKATIELQRTTTPRLTTVDLTQDAIQRP